VARAPRSPNTDRPAEGGRIHALPVSFPDDAALVAACVAKDPAAARTIWDRYAVLVRGLLRRTLGRSDVEDTVQDAFMRFFRLVPRLREPSKLRSFVVGVAMRVAREELRRRRVRRWLTLSADGLVPESAAPSRDPDAAEALRRLDALLDRLDPDARIVFVLRFVEDVPTTEIAESLGCSLATAKRRVKRARERVEAAAEKDPVLCAYVRGGDDD
jgi:RNA polymerase sigma-70 factor (ECF subfamily)